MNTLFNKTFQSGLICTSFSLILGMRGISRDYFRHLNFSLPAQRKLDFFGTAFVFSRNLLSPFFFYLDLSLLTYTGNSNRALRKQQQMFFN